MVWFADILFQNIKTEYETPPELPSSQNEDSERETEAGSL